MNTEELKFDSDADISDVSEAWSEYGDAVVPQGKYLLCTLGVSCFQFDVHAPCQCYVRILTLLTLQLNKLACA